MATTASAMMPANISALSGAASGAAGSGGAAVTPRAVCADDVQIPRRSRESCTCPDLWEPTSRRKRCPNPCRPCYDTETEYCI
jgi:hypothetical protein